MRTTRSRKSHHSGKENGTASLPSTSSASSIKGKEKAVPKRSARNVGVKKEKEELLFCSCRGVDDGTPMVQCGNCDDWYHFRCVNLSEDDASEIMVYVCSSCQEKTGWRTVSKCQTRSDMRGKRFHYPTFFLPYCCTLPYCNTRTTTRVCRNTLSCQRLPA
ncbi:hypothetical protein EDB85DRAFT_1180549 [Lactarius pseudohatsudake]|nr:hypothetical protein EDB85DRAFT_1180549 [Lactarius pseudohatsudake]